MHKRILFLRYDERSGSTLLSALLNRYESISVSHESSFVSRVIDYSDPLRCPGDVSNIISYLFSEAKFSNLNLTKSEVAAAIESVGPMLSKQNVIAAVMRCYFEKRDSRADVWVLKQPLWHHFEQAQRLFPEIRMLHLVRDGRAVYNSKRQTRVGAGRVMQSNLLHAAYKWRHKIDIVDRQREYTYELRYEDLIADPDTALQGVLDFLELPQGRRKVSKSQQEYFDDIDEPHKSIHQNVRHQPLAENVEKWRLGLDATDVQLYEFVNGNYLRRYGYAPPGCDSVGPLSFPKLVMRAAYYLAKYASYRIQSGLTK